MGDVADELQELDRRASELAGRRQQFEERAADEREKEQKAKRARRTAERALTVARTTAQETLSQLSYRLTEPATLALQGVFPDPYELKIQFVPRRGQTECDVWFERRGTTVDPLEAAGLGAADIAGFGIQMAMLSMEVEAGKTMPVYLGDEPFKHLKGAEANRNAIEMVREISQQLGIQVIMVSDERAAREDIVAGADRVFVLKHDGEKTVVERNDDTPSKNRN